MCNTLLRGFQSYYGSVEFQRDLMRWFDIGKSCSVPEFPWIGFASRSGNPHRPQGIPSSTKEKSFYFSFCVFLHSLQPQVIYRLSGREVMYRFHAETGVPRFRAVWGVSCILHTPCGRPSCCHKAMMCVTMWK